jgi:hypothetical protein
MRGAIPLLPQYVFTARYLIKHGDNFTFTGYITSNSRMTVTEEMCKEPVVAYFKVPS